MKFLEIFRFEMAYQLRRAWPWISLIVLIAFSFENTRVGVLPVTLSKDFVLNSPFIIANVSVISCLVWLLIAAPIAGEAAARDLQTNMHPLMYSAPITKLQYLGGRFLSAFVLSALVLLGVQIGSILAVYAGGVDPSIIGPFRPYAYLSAYIFIALPNAFVATAFQFVIALRSGRSLTSYFGSIMLLFFTVPVPLIVYFALKQPALALMMDPIGMLAIMNEMMLKWTIVEKNVRMFTLEGPMLSNRLLWLSVALGTLAFTYFNFRFTHRTAASPLNWIKRMFPKKDPTRIEELTRGKAISIPPIAPVFGYTTSLVQLSALAISSFVMLAKSVAGLFLLIVFPAFVIIVVFVQQEHWGIPLEPWTGYILSKRLTAPITHVSDFRAVIPLVIIYLSGVLLWRERDARLNENIDAIPVSDWALFLGKFVGLTLLLALFMLCLTAAGVTAQTLMGYFHFEIGLYFKILFGLQLPEYLLLAMLAFVVQVILNQKHVGMLATAILYVLIVCAPLLHIRHNLLIFSGSPGWSFTDMRGFGSSLGPWLWFKGYWIAWAALLAVLARLLWIRGTQATPGTRFRGLSSRLSFATTTLGIGAAACALVSGIYIFYNTNVLNQYHSDEEMLELRADYEKQYGKYEGIPQPQRIATKLQIDIHPKKSLATILGSYNLVNRDSMPIKTVHVEAALGLSTKLAFDKPATLVSEDDRLGHYIYQLNQPLQSGDTLTLNFSVTIKPRGFTNEGKNIAVIKNGTYFTGSTLPVIGYQSFRELLGAEDRRKHGLPRQITLPSPGDINPNLTAIPPATLEAVVSTDEDQVAVAPGELRRTWTADNGRRYFHYGSSIPLEGLYLFFSADYAVHRELRNGVDIQIFTHHAHSRNVERLLRSVRASLDYYSQQFGPYPYRFLQVIEQPGNFMGMGVDGSGVVTAGEGIFSLHPEGEGFDAIFEIAAHEMGHQWWGVQLKGAFAEGGGVISESLAWYSAMQLVKKEKGREALRRFMSFMREPNPWPQIRTGLPLIRAMDPWANYRKGPYAMHALCEYMGEYRVNSALRTLVQKKKNELATTRDLYRELKAVTPDSVRTLLQDLFEVNAFWNFDTKQAIARQSPTGAWEVTFEFEAHKVIADSAGVENEVPVDEWIEVGVFAAAEPGEILGKLMYVQRHFIKSGIQTIRITVPEKPVRGGIDPYSLLDWEEGDNIEEIKFE